MSSAPFVGVLALQGDVREHVDALVTAGARSGAIRTFEDLRSCDALVIPGGESTTMSRLARIDGWFDPLRAARSAGMPMFGTCAGMIMLADQVLDARSDQETIGGLDVVVRRNAFGRQVDSFETDIAVPVLGPEAFHAVFIRAPWVEGVGSGVEVLAEISDGDRAGTIVAIRHGGLLATSFHPELTSDVRFHRYFLEMVQGEV
ncbi:pyridoxal 5'-phosphate synthase glutaminase subunit PdxT [bacterium]|nr:pyridoxal 5'-phosphate synthase glutaminase subunit PdxT [bacterium]MDC3376961.1 pyridoxal 5'-phosphate synthase glutaminase subunit PdxT [Candidatus Nanopelagicales bacterium]